MWLSYSLSREKEADAIEKAVEEVLNQGHRTQDIAKKEQAIGLSKMTELVISNIE